MNATLQVVQTQSLTESLTVQAVHAYLKSKYRHERFEGRNDEVWGEDYSMKIAQHHLDNLQKFGQSFISRHESAAGQVICYNQQFEEKMLNGSAPSGATCH